MKVAVVHDWLVTYGGAERVLEQILNIFPDADLFTLIDFLDDSDRSFVKNKKAETTFVQLLPFVKSNYRSYFPLFPIAIKQYNLQKYDIVISSSHCVAKSVSTHSHQLHICYCYTPARYAWDLQNQYLSDLSVHSIKKIVSKHYLNGFRIWDRRKSKSVDYFISCSNYISQRIKQSYQRSSQTIYPNVSVESFDLCEVKDDYFVTCSRIVSYKKVDLIVQAFSKMPDKQLIVIGDGPEFQKLKIIASDNVTLMGYQPSSVLKEKVKKARAFIFAAEEDFGIAPVEAMASGTPVIAFGRGGLLETVINRKTGIFFHEQSAESIKNAVLLFEETTLLPPIAIRQHALKFSSERFRHEFTHFVKQCWNKHRSDQLQAELPST